MLQLDDVARCYIGNFVGKQLCAVYTSTHEFE